MAPSAAVQMKQRMKMRMKQRMRNRMMRRKQRRSGFKDTGRIEPIPNPYNPPCDKKWETTRDELAAALAKWPAPECYKFKLTIGCFCPEEYRGPHKVKVRKGKVVGDNPYSLPTMEEIYENIQDQCIEECPETGAERCEVKYGADGEVVQLSIDRSFHIADEEIYYQIEDFRLCGEDE